MKYEVLNNSIYRIRNSNRLGKYAKIVARQELEEIYICPNNLKTIIHIYCEEIQHFKKQRQITNICCDFLNYKKKTAEKRTENLTNEIHSASNKVHIG